MNEYLTKIMLYHQVHEKDQEGVSITKIAEQTQLNWRTVKRLLALNEKDFLESIEQKGRKKTLSDYGEFVREKLLKHPDTSAAQMFDWLKERYPDLPSVSVKTIFNFVLAIRRKYNIPKEA